MYSSDVLNTYIETKNNQILLSNLQHEDLHITLYFKLVQNLINSYKKMNLYWLYK